MDTPNAADTPDAPSPRRKDMRIFDLLARAREGIDGRVVFGEPVERGGVILVPAARVQGGMGGGGGEVGPDDRHEASHGGGMGLGLQARPAGAFIIRDGNVEWQAAVDTTRILLAAIAATVAVVWMVSRVARR